MQSENKIDMEMDIDLGNRCNNRCIYCCNSTHSHFRPIDSVKRDIDIASKGSAAGIILNGGEPTIRKDLIDIVRYAKSCGFSKIWIITNGRMLSYRSFCRNLINSGVSKFMISLSSHNPKTHDEITRTPGGFEQAVNGIKNALEYGAQVSTCTVVNRMNYEKLDETARFIASLGVNEAKFSCLRPIGLGRDNMDEISVKMNDVKEHLAKALEICASYKLTSTVVAFPFCIIPERFWGSVPTLIGVSAWSTESVKSYITKRFDDTRAKSVACTGCRMHDACIGPWKEYTEIFGFSEFDPAKCGG